MCPQLRLSIHYLPKTALASFPGSGNTWTRHLLQQMTGILTGAAYNNEFLLHHGFPGEGIHDGRVVAIKTHAYFKPTHSYDRCILLIRNPFEAFIAEFNRFYTQNTTGFAKLEEFVNNWNPFFDVKCYFFRTFYISWLKQRNIHLVLYDNLKKDLAKELQRMLVFLQNSTKIIGKVQCALNNSTGTMKRDRSRSLPYEFFYTTYQVQRLNQIISYVSGAYYSRFPEEASLMKKWIVVNHTIWK